MKYNLIMNLAIVSFDNIINRIHAINLSGKKCNGSSDYRKNGTEIEKTKNLKSFPETRLEASVVCHERNLSKIQTTRYT